MSVSTAAAHALGFHLGLATRKLRGMAPPGEDSVYLRRSEPIPIYGPDDEIVRYSYNDHWFPDVYQVSGLDTAAYPYPFLYYNVSQKLYYLYHLTEKGKVTAIDTESKTVQLSHQGGRLYRYNPESGSWAFWSTNRAGTVSNIRPFWTGFDIDMETVAED